MLRYGVLMLVALPALADIYVQIDAEGRKTYTNLPLKGAKKVDLGNLPKAIAAPRKHKSTGSTSIASLGSYSAPSPGNFPRVDSQTQNARDKSRMEILQSELGSEQKLLDEGRLALGSAPAGKIARIRDDITLHEKNIDALKKEMSLVR